jgi:hypothetical protein
LLKNKAVEAFDALLMPDPAVSFFQKAFIAIPDFGTLL